VTTVAFPIRKLPIWTDKVRDLGMSPELLRLIDFLGMRNKSLMNLAIHGDWSVAEEDEAFAQSYWHVTLAYGPFPNLILDP
jgi:hypothetical protein